MNTVVYNHTKYSDEVLQELSEFAHQKAGIKGQVAVIFRYHAHSTGYIGMMMPCSPLFHEVAGNLKKFRSKMQMVRAGDYNPNVSSSFQDKEVAMATSDGAFGYITVRVPKPNSYSRLTTYDAQKVINTTLHEMFHIKQYRDQKWALKDSACSSWTRFLGYSGQYAAKRSKHQARPIEQHVNRLLKDLQPILDNSFDYELIQETLVAEFTSEKVKKKAKKQTVKYNKWGERISDYRNVKMKTLRSGDKVVVCPHCGEKAVKLDEYDDSTYTHIAAVNDEMTRYGGFTVSEARYTQFGHRIHDNGLVETIVMGYPSKGETVDQSVFKVYGNRGYRW